MVLYLRIRPSLISHVFEQSFLHRGQALLITQEVAELLLKLVKLALQVVQIIGDFWLALTITLV